MSEHSYEQSANAGVDEVVESLEQLEGAPVAEHVRVFESAHEKLRNALTEATDATDAGGTADDDSSGS